MKDSERQPRSSPSNRGIRRSPTLRTDIDVLSLDIGELRGLAEPRKLSSAEGWLKAYKEMCAEVEIENGSDEDASWLPPATPPEPSSLARVLIALAELGGRARVKDLTALITERFDVIARDNNTRREVIRHGDLLRFDPDNHKIVEQTARGALYLRAYVNAGGDVGKE